MRKPDSNISIYNPPCYICSESYVNLSIHLGKKHKILSQSKIAIRARVMRARRWLRTRLQNIEGENL